MKPMRIYSTSKKLNVKPVRKVPVKNEESLLQERESHKQVKNHELPLFRALLIETIYNHNLLGERDQKSENSPSRKKRKRYNRLAVKFRGKITLSPNQRVWVRYYDCRRPPKKGGLRYVKGPYFNVNIKIADKRRNILVGKNPKQVAARLEIPEKEALGMCIKALKKYLAKSHKALIIRQAEMHLKLYWNRASELGIMADLT